MGKITLINLFVFLFILSFTVFTIAAQNVTQDINFTVSAINEIAVSGDPGALSISSGTAGNANLTDATDFSTNYSITTNGSGKNITGQITAGGDMPAGTSLKINLAAPTGGTSAGTQDISNSLVAQTLVTGISKRAQSTLLITYTLSATVDAGEVSGNKTITLTITP